MTDTPYRYVWGYGAHRDITATGSHTTPDGIRITPEGSANNPRMQKYVFQQGDKIRTFKGYWGAESLFHAMRKFQQDLPD